MYNNDNNSVGHVSDLFSPSFGFSDQRISHYQVNLKEVGLPRYMLGSELDDDGGYNNGLYGHSTLPFDQTADYEGDAKLHNNDLGQAITRHMLMDPTKTSPTRQPGIYIGTGFAKQQALLDIKYGRETEFTKKYRAGEYRKDYGTKIDWKKMKEGFYDKWLRPKPIGDYAITRRHKGATIDPTYVRPPQKPSKYKVDKGGRIIDPYSYGPVTNLVARDKANGYGRGGRWGTGAGGRWGFGNRAAETVQAPSMVVKYPRPDRPQRRPTRGARPFAFGGRGIFAWLRKLFAAKQEQDQVPVRRVLPGLPGADVDESLIY